jgi:hypothetical protein
VKQRSDGTFRPDNASYDLGPQGVAAAPNLAYEPVVTFVRRKPMKPSPLSLTTIVALSACGLLSACSSSGGPPAYATAAAVSAEPSQVFWGDTHLHTSYSPDAFFFGNATADPDTAYRYAKGYPVVHPYHKAKIQIGTPLDFLVVADHAEMMGVPFRRIVKMLQAGKGQEVFVEFVGRINTNTPYEDLNGEDTRKSVWSDMVAITERHNAPGRFTSFIGWEWTSTPNGKNLHRSSPTARSTAISPKTCGRGSRRLHRGQARASRPFPTTPTSAVA